MGGTWSERVDMITRAKGIVSPAFKYRSYSAQIKKMEQDFKLNDTYFETLTAYVNDLHHHDPVYLKNFTESFLPTLRSQHPEQFHKYLCQIMVLRYSKPGIEKGKVLLRSATQYSSVLQLIAI